MKLTKSVSFKKKLGTSFNTGKNKLRTSARKLSGGVPLEIEVSFEDDPQTKKDVGCQSSEYSKVSGSEVMSMSSKATGSHRSGHSRASSKVSSKASSKIFSLKASKVASKELTKTSPTNIKHADTASQANSTNDAQLENLSAELVQLKQLLKHEKSKNEKAIVNIDTLNSEVSHLKALLKENEKLRSYPSASVRDSEAQTERNNMKPNGSNVRAISSKDSSQKSVSSKESTMTSSTASREKSKSKILAAVTNLGSKSKVFKGSSEKIDPRSKTDASTTSVSSKSSSDLSVPPEVDVIESKKDAASATTEGGLKAEEKVPTIDKVVLKKEVPLTEAVHHKEAVIAETPMPQKYDAVTIMERKSEEDKTLTSETEPVVDEEVHKEDVSTAAEHFEEDVVADNKDMCKEDISNEPQREVEPKAAIVLNVAIPSKTEDAKALECLSGVRAVPPIDISPKEGCTVRTKSAKVVAVARLLEPSARDIEVFADDSDGTELKWNENTFPTDAEMAEQFVSLGKLDTVFESSIEAVQNNEGVSIGFTDNMASYEDDRNDLNEEIRESSWNCIRG